MIEKEERENQGEEEVRKRGTEGRGPEKQEREE
jgi:hypothetical protein